MTTLKNIQQFRAAGAIVSREPVVRHIEWTATDPATGEDVNFDADIRLVKPGAGLMSDIFGTEDKQQIANAISKCLLLENDKGKLEHLSYDDVYHFDTPLMMAVWNELQVLSGLAKKNSLPAKNSSANSSSTESAAQP